MADTSFKKESETTFWSTCYAWFFHKNIPYVILCQLTKFQCHTIFSFSRSATKCVIKFLLRQLMTSSWFIFDHPHKQWPTGERRVEDGKQNIFHNYLGAVIWWKKEK